MATLKFVRERTPIPVPAVLAFALLHTQLGTVLLIEKVLLHLAITLVNVDIARPPQAPGVPLAALYATLSLAQKTSLASQLAKYTLALTQHRFSTVGSLTLSPSPSSSRSPSPSHTDSHFSVGPIVRPLFYTDGRAKLPLDRGPFPSVTAYVLACAQRELDCARMLGAQASSEEYRREVEEGRLGVERSMGLLVDLVERTGVLDSDLDLEGALLGCGSEGQFTLGFPELDGKRVYVDPGDPSKIVRSLSSFSKDNASPLTLGMRPWLDVHHNARALA